MIAAMKPDSTMKPASLPRLGLGMAALGRPGYINLNRESTLGNNRPVELMQKQANIVMDKLFELSDNPWLDCARSYGVSEEDFLRLSEMLLLVDSFVSVFLQHQLSEKFVGEYLRARKTPPDDVYVSSKWGYSKFYLIVI